MKVSEFSTKTFTFNTNPNLHKSLIQKHIGNWKKQTEVRRYEAKFMNQYESHFDWHTRPRIEVLYREGGRQDMKVYTGLTEYGCGITLKRPYSCWCKQEEEKRRVEAEEKKRKELLKAVTRRLQKQIEQKANTTSRWGPNNNAR